MFLTLDIPACPLFKDNKKQSVIPHEPIFNLLKKYDGKTPFDHAEGKSFYKINVKILQ
jgi:U4/U6.U5 tri-snRNP-associated protein 2